MDTWIAAKALGTLRFVLAGGGHSGEAARIDPSQMEGLSGWLARLHQSMPVLYAAGMVVCLIGVGLVFGLLSEMLMELFGWETEGGGH